MSDLKLPEKIADVAADIVENHAGETYDNLIQEPSKALGEGLAELIELIMFPVKHAKSKAEIWSEYSLAKYKLKKEIEEKEKSVPEEKRIEPDFQTVTIALENSKYCITNDDLRHMFVNLIGNTMNSDTADSVHPAFAEMIRQMNPVDAQILKSFSTIHIQPIMEIHQLLKSLNAYSTAYTNLFLVKEAPVQSLSKANIAITNLNRLGLVNIDYTKSISEETVYKDLVKVADNMTRDFSLSDFKYMQGVVSITPLGQKFLKICLSD